MPDSQTPSAPVPSSATSAFLRGIERRAYVFAHVQCGGEREAEIALERTIHAFRTLATVSPLSSWPAGFWSLLLAQEGLSGGVGGVPELVTLGSGPRAALLLRLVAGLDFAHAAQVLGVSEDTYRFALERALQQLGAAGVSYAGLRTLRERLHRQVKTLPDERTRALAALRERALGMPAEVPAGRPPVPRPPWLLRALWAALGVLALVFAGTFIDFGPGLPPGRTDKLPEETVEPVPTTPAADVVMHPDYAQLAAPDDARIAEDLALLSWLANHPEVLAEADADAAPADADPDADAHANPDTEKTPEAADEAP